MKIYYELSHPIAQPRDMLSRHLNLFKVLMGQVYGNLKENPLMILYQVQDLVHGHLSPTNTVKSCETTFFVIAQPPDMSSHRLHPFNPTITQVHWNLMEKALMILHQVLHLVLRP